MHPYSNIPPHAHWRKSISEVQWSEVDPVVACKFRVTKRDKVATAGSCFAQHIARYLKAEGFNYYVVEPGHPFGSEAIRQKYNYGVFSGRYGNIYTSRQLVQLFDRAYGVFEPAEDIWVNAAGRCFDPYRPNIQECGFASEKEMELDRTTHLAAVRRMFDTLDVFVFTLGLTEAWVSAIDGAVFPVCPGVVAGTFDAERHKFVNLTVNNVIKDLEEFLDRLQSVNPRARIIFTVSPVPLVATAEDRSVLVSTTLSKSVLRVAADVVERANERVAYFPSYEIITGAFSRGRYFGPDLRNVTEEGVQHVMRLFLKHGSDATGSASAMMERPAADDDVFVAEAAEIVKVICDEEMIVLP